MSTRVQGNKYGCEMADTGPLLLLASSLGIRVSGVSFHVGSGAMSPEAFSAAIYKARQVGHYFKYQGGAELRMRAGRAESKQFMVNSI